MKTIIIVPARSGSKGIKNKNLSYLNKKPLIYYTLAICKKLKNKYETLISTDSDKIAAYCKLLGFKTTYRRPKKLSRSNSKMSEAAIHGINWYQKNYKKKISHIILLQPTSPLRKINDVISAIKTVKKENLDSLASISTAKQSSMKFLKIKKTNTFNKWKFSRKRKKIIHNRQNFDANEFIFNGSIYVASVDFLKKYKRFVVENRTYLFKSHEPIAVDIANNEDLFLAELIIKNKKNFKI